MASAGAAAAEIVPQADLSTSSTSTSSSVASRRKREGVYISTDPLSVGTWSKVELSPSSPTSSVSSHENGEGGEGRGGGAADATVQPCQRSLHVGAVLNDCLLIFGGYDGANRVNDFYEYSFVTRKWRVIEPQGSQPPSPRDRHVAVVYRNSFYVFGGFDGTSRVNDFYEYNFDLNEWKPVVCLSGSGPTPRHSHSAAVHKSSMYICCGYDGSYTNSFIEFNFTTNSWAPVAYAGRLPRARYRATCSVNGDNLYLFGGHDGTKHLNDVNVFNFEGRTWTTLATEGLPPLPRDSHVSVIHNKCMYVYGGSTGNAMDDLHELDIEEFVWRPILPTSSTPQPGQRFCHVAVVWRHAIYVFGGYDGASRLNDFWEFKFGPGLIACEIPDGTLLTDLKSYVNQKTQSDVTFMVEDRPIYAHKILCMRCTYFRAMFTGEMKEAREKEVILHDVRYPIFLLLLEYLYTDAVHIDSDMVVMELFQAADRYGVDRLKKICEHKMLTTISIENAASIFHAADVYHALSLREKCLAFILQNFDDVTKTSAFEEMGRTNIDLVFEILHKH